MEKIKILFILNFAKRCDLVALWDKYKQRIWKNTVDFRDKLIFKDRNFKLYHLSPGWHGSVV